MADAFHPIRITSLRSPGLGALVAFHVLVVNALASDEVAGAMWIVTVRTGA